MKKLKIAQIGIGHDHAPMIFESLKKQNDLFEIVGYALPENEASKFCDKLECFQGFSEMSVQEIMEDPEIVAVTIETEEVSLTKYALLAAEHHKHIHMDKPGGTDKNEFEQLINLCKANKLVFHLGYMYRYNPEVIKLFQDAENGELGEIFAVEAQMNCIFPSTPEKRQWLEQFDGGIMFFLGCHMIDLVLRIQGIPERIIPLNRSTKLDGVTSVDYGMAIFEYRNGLSFVKCCAREVGGYNRRQLVVHGTKKTVEIKPIEFIEEDGMHAKTTCYSIESQGSEISDAYDRYDSMIESFAAMVRGEKENPYSYDYELELYKTISIAGGKISG